MADSTDPIVDVARSIRDLVAAMARLADEQARTHARIDAIERQQAAHIAASQPVIEAHGVYLSSLQRQVSEVAAEASAATLASADRERAARASVTARLWAVADRIAVPILIGAAAYYLGSGAEMPPAILPTTPREVHDASAP